MLESCLTSFIINYKRPCVCLSLLLHFITDMLQELIIKETVHALTFRVFPQLVILYTIDSKQYEGRICLHDFSISLHRSQCRINVN